MSKNIVIGAGAWGTAIANLIAQNGHEICAISDITEISKEVNQNHTHPALNGVKLHPNLRASTDLAGETQNAENIFIVVPSNVVLIILEQIKHLNCNIIICTKGLEHASLKLFSEICQEIMPKNPLAVLSGPNFAIEVAQNTPTATNIATKNQQFGEKIIKTLQNDWFKPILSSQIITAEISAIIKNILAIACGICDGLNLGENTKAALILRGCAEIQTLATALGEQNPSLNTPFGFGDIFLTCSTTKSRNNSLGQALGKGQKYQDLAKQKTYEGAINATAINNLAKKLEVSLPLCQTVDDILQNGYGVSEIETKIVGLV